MAIFNSYVKLPEGRLTFWFRPRRQVNNYFLPKTAAERRAVKQKTTAMLSAKVSQTGRLVFWGSPAFGKLPSGNLT